VGHRLEVSGLVKGYRGRTVVDGVSLSLGSGEVVGLLGPNGAGKTTTFFMTVGLIRPDSGSVSLDGEEMAQLPVYQRARKGLAYLPQEPSIFRNLSVGENLLIILEHLRMGADERRQRMDQLLEELGLTSLKQSLAHTLSGGERRRLEIARALVTNPKFLLLDEPFAGIDPIAVADIQRIVFRLREAGIGVLITDHNVRETLAITDRTYIISQGRILESGSPQEIAGSEKAREIYLGRDFRLEIPSSGEQR
jgi:lipopolysaccharide export system ATP-binding protein